MKVFDANISYRVSFYLNENLKSVASFEMANHIINETFGIIHFFGNNEEMETLQTINSGKQGTLNEVNRAEYGDFQTNAELADKVIVHLLSRNISPDIVVEPTCGTGNFIIAALKIFQGIKNIFGFEIFGPYVWETKFNIIDYFLDNPEREKPQISICHCNVFDFDFRQIARNYSSADILVIGNPPWVTNSKLGCLNSANLPAKTNFKNHNGLDAITGKGNFDIAEFITLTMIETFQKLKGNLVLLVKDSVIRNIVSEQYKNKNSIGSLEKHFIDSKKEFNVSVGASLFYCRFNSVPEFDCQEFSFYNNRNLNLKFGWSEDKFVSNLDKYINSKKIDGVCPFIWRQGLKHDCSKVMELSRANGHYVNGLNEKVKLEDNLVYGFLKSSDLKNNVINQTRKFVIVTQRKVGQETDYIKNEFPETYKYLTGHQEKFEARKSGIYKNKPVFSIFGIGDYSFEPYKVAISGFYKTYHFTLVLPQENKPVMFDDTCYLIGFEKIEFAVYALILLNSEMTMQFLQSVTFSYAKRPFTKEVLMRIDLPEIARCISRLYLATELDSINEMYKLNLTLNLWDEFIAEMVMKGKPFHSLGVISK